MVAGDLERATSGMDDGKSRIKRSRVQLPGHWLSGGSAMIGTWVLWSLQVPYQVVWDAIWSI